ncbi:NAD-glutamate dehydrogenase [Sabulicella glaciei]|uniref:NAD-glutamate dehydrogenase n=1 Tax=Sabulicella glaciei TaxID=2984948 RepID=A0ABT3NQB1_9PROT|nr:NAD-glutamate dehydrogenase domain-containing protein [Roseococcus sp. MDT2-1-1]MCW8084344.1 NAD-glutamate dehydrogenase [Roseococcus sp. MDT2-1-1]
MPEAPNSTRDPLRQEILAAASRRVPEGFAQRLLPALFHDVPTPELAARPPEALAAAAASLADLAASRRKDEAAIRLTPPGAGSGPHAVAELVTDDMPFLVDSVLAALTQHGRVVKELLHPILDGQSLMRVSVAAAPGQLLSTARPGDWPTVEAALRRAMADVRAAVSDFPRMAELLRGAEEEAGGGEAAEFLRWMGDDNFVLLGHRRLVLNGEGAEAVPEENLGLLRSPELPVFDALAHLPEIAPSIRAALVEGPPVTVAKANMRATVHRPQHADVVATRGPDGARLFLGLFAAAAYNRNPRSIPLLRGKVERILDAAGVSPSTHDGRALRNILDTWPRDELFQASEAEILEGARRALDLTIRPRPALYLRRDPFGRFTSAIAWLPRESFDTRLRHHVGGMLARALGGRLSAFYIALGDAPLARVHYIIGTDPTAAREVDQAALEAAITQAARSFPERLAEALSAERGEAAAGEALSVWRDAFPASYREGEDAGSAGQDLALAERAVGTNRPAALLARAPGAPADRVVLRLAMPGAPLALADVLPIFESLDLRAIEEVPHRLSPQGREAMTLHVFQLDVRAKWEEGRAPLLLDALDALLSGQAEADGFNRLILRAGLSWRECWLLRAIFRWCKQVGFPFAQESVTAALAQEAKAAGLLVRLFHARFAEEPGGNEEEAEAAFARALDEVADRDADRILRRMKVVLDAMLRTNFFGEKPYLAFKLDSARAGDMPAPRPWREIFVHTPTMEGCHLRAGPVARGGIRWSDRREDFRTEILGLMKAQRLKNVVIVPTGAKGGFVLKGVVPTEREALQQTGIAAYKSLVRGMLDLTDNLRGKEVVTPPGIRRRDGDDPYIVAAADKGTATFSDIANGLSDEYGFWLGDAFASGGSAGYDHKGMGITARGAWVMVERHFTETLGRSIHDAPFTASGVGDMSGDVFGNGLLISKQTKLLAAFDHRHIFLDPDPDPAESYAERERLFGLPRSSWADYDAGRISRGGGVFSRQQKTIPLSPEAREMLGIEAESAEPAEVMRAILRMRVDLLYFGGIGTYVKSSAESHADAGDRANDAIRVDGKDLHARVVGEGANLAVTQSGRVEAARAGVRLNTDAMDNSAGVSTSDHEVNIKILLADAEAEGVLTRRGRDDLLAAMTEEVAALVLRDNHLQSVALSLEGMAGAAALPAHTALMARLEAEGILDREVAGLPDAAALAERIVAGDALTRPAIAALMPFAKLWLAEALGESTLPDNPEFSELLHDYFPTPLREEPYAGFIARHRLRRELVATALSNRVVNRLGLAGLSRLTAEAGPAEIVAAAFLADALFGLEARFEEAEALPPDERLAAQCALRELMEAATAELLPFLRQGIGPALTELRPGLAALAVGQEAASLRDFLQSAPRLAVAPPILRLAARQGAAPPEAAKAWEEVGQHFMLDALRDAIRRAPLRGPFADRARAALLGELRDMQSRLAASVLQGRAPEPGAAVPLLRDATRTPDFAAASVALRALALVEA